MICLPSKHILLFTLTFFPSPGMYFIMLKRVGKITLAAPLLLSGHKLLGNYMYILKNEKVQNKCDKKTHCKLQSLLLQARDDHP